MKSNAGTLRLALFLCSIFVYSSIFLRVYNRYSPTDLAISKAIVHPGPVVFKSTLFSANNFSKFSESVSDTIRKKDRDGDGVADSLDKCPDEKGSIQYDGCPVPDSDNDGIADDSDACPLIAGTLKYKGCPVPDSDGDKINDENDKCPHQPGVARYDGCPVGDKDGDGVNDDDDKCIDVAGTVNNGGCPENKKTAVQSSKQQRKKNGL